MANENWWLILIFPIGVLLYALHEESKTTPTLAHILEETSSTWLVKTQNHDCPHCDTVNLNGVKIDFGTKDDKVVIKQIEYQKDRYSKEDVAKLMEGKLSNCPRCTIK